MDEIKWLEVTVNTAPQDLDALTNRLTMNGVTGFVIEDEADFKQFLEQNRQYWDYVDDDLLAAMKGVTRVKFYVTDDADGEAQRASWMAGIDLPYTVLKLQENEWAFSWQKYYRPMAVGARLYIIPEWEKETAQTPAGRTPLYLNPGLIFGTGSHASTQLCLELVERLVEPHARVLDLGCGSGILSLAALALGAATAVGVDIDPKAVGVAYDNARLSGIGPERLFVRAGDLITDERLRAELAQTRYELVLANIVADVILSLSVPVKQMLAPGGLFVCSGIIDTRGDEVEAALHRCGYAILERNEKNGWLSFVTRLLST